MPVFHLVSPKPSPKRIQAALDLLEAAEKWRASYYRGQKNPDELRSAAELYEYDCRRTDFGDDAFDLLMDYTEPTE